MANRSYETPLPFPPEMVRAWHERVGAFDRLQPPWDVVKVVESKGTVFEGDRLVMQMAPGVRWVAVHHGHPDGFIDEMESGPFSSWRHTHRFLSDGAGGTVIRDEISFTPDVLGVVVDRKMPPMFAFRKRRLHADLSRHVGKPKQRILLAGASGLIGAALSAFLTTGGNEVVQLVRRDPGPGQVRWSPDRADPDSPELVAALNEAAGPGFDAVISLGGEAVGEGRWTDARKEQLTQSRLRPTALLAKTLGKLAVRPRVWVSASAVGFYGDTGDTAVSEESPRGGGFLAELCEKWEAAATLPGVRVVHARIGVVLSGRGGALTTMLPPFRMGAGGPMGGGRHYFPWIGHDDVIYALHHLLHDDTLSGPVNLVAPEATRQGELATALGRAVGMPAFTPLPAFAIKLGFGQMGEEMLLAGQHARPTRLSGRFVFSTPTLKEALEAELGP